MTRTIACQVPALSAMLNALGAVKLIVIDCGSSRSGLTGQGTGPGLGEPAVKDAPPSRVPQNPPSLFGVSASKPSTLRMLNLSSRVSKPYIYSNPPSCTDS